MRCKRREHGAGVVDAAGQHEVADEHAALRQPVASDPQRADLAHHFGDRLPVGGGVARGAAQVPRAAAAGVLHVGEVDVDDALEQPQHRERLVAAAVPDDRQGETRRAAR